MSAYGVTLTQPGSGFVWRCGELSTGQLIALLQAHFPQPGAAVPDPPKPRYLVWRPNGTEFEYFKPGLAGHAIVNWNGGRVFSSDQEIRWLKVAEGSYDVLILAERSLPLGDGFKALAGPWRVVERSERTHSIFLWGEHRPEWEEEWRGLEKRPYWVETRIPMRLYYPVEEAGAARSFVRISYRLYQTDQGVTQFIRLAEVRDVPAKER